MKFVKLVAKAKKGNRKAVTQLIEQYKPMLNGICRRLIWLEKEERMAYAIDSFIKNIRKFNMSYCDKMVEDGKRRNG